MSNVPKMLEIIRASWNGSEIEFDLKLKRYYLSCCRAIWKLLPQENSRKGVEVAERYLNGLATEDELNRAEYYAEGAAFNLDYNCSPADIEKMVEQLQAISTDELRTMIYSIDEFDDVSPQEILTRAAYFADFAIVYPNINPKNLPHRYIPFLSPHLLYEIFDDTALSEKNVE